eukprot:1136641-Pelagomonas_calceolata.AAC.8
MTEHSSATIHNAQCRRGSLLSPSHLAPCSPHACPLVSILLAPRLKGVGAFSLAASIETVTLVLLFLAVMNQPGPGDEEVEHNMPRGQLAQALLEITNFIRQSTQQQQRQQQQQPVGWEMHHAGEPDEGRGAGHMVSTGEEESEWEEADGADAGEEDSYTTASTSVAEEPPSGGGEEGQEGQGSA